MTGVLEKVCAEVSIDGKMVGVLLFSLFGKAAPETVQHFLSQLDEEEENEESEKPDLSCCCTVSCDLSCQKKI